MVVVFATVIVVSPDHLVRDLQDDRPARQRRPNSPAWTSPSTACTATRSSSSRTPSSKASRPSRPPKQRAGPRRGGLGLSGGQLVPSSTGLGRRLGERRPLRRVRRQSSARSVAPPSGRPRGPSVRGARARAKIRARRRIYGGRPRADRGAGDALERHAPIVVHDRDEPEPLTSVRAFAARARSSRTAAAGWLRARRRAGQYWCCSPDNQTWAADRRQRATGRISARRCVAPPGVCGPGGERPWSIASTPTPTVPTGPGRTQHVPTRGPRMRPPVVRIDESRPPWMRYRGRWGAVARASLPLRLAAR